MKIIRHAALPLLIRQAEARAAEKRATRARRLAWLRAFLQSPSDAVVFLLALCGLAILLLLTRCGGTVDGEGDGGPCEWRCPEDAAGCAVAVCVPGSSPEAGH